MDPDLTLERDDYREGLRAMRADRDRLRAAIERVVNEEWDDLDPDDGLHLRGARMFLQGVLAAR